MAPRRGHSGCLQDFWQLSVGVLGDADIFCCLIQDSVEVHTLGVMMVMFVQSLLI